MEGIVRSLMSASVLLDTLEGIARVGCDDVNTVALSGHLGSIQFLYILVVGSCQFSHSKITLGIMKCTATL